MEPFIPPFAEFEKYKGKKVLEIGVGAGVDFGRWIKEGAGAVGIDLTYAALTHTKERIGSQFPSQDHSLLQADAEHLPFKENQFDLAYSYGCLHHTPDTPAAFKEAFRVLKTGGELKAMIYHVPSWTGLQLWVLNCLLKGRPWKTPKQAIFENLESPGTKAYTISEAVKMLSEAGFKEISAAPKLGHGDLLTLELSEKYQKPVFKLAQRLYPRWLVRLLGHRFGTMLLLKAKK